MFTKLRSPDISPTSLSLEGYPPSLLRGTKGNCQSGKNNPKLVSFLLTKLPQKNTSNQGFSLLECLIGIIIIAVVITTITPPIFLAVGTRIQNRRAEQALQLAQGEIDRVRRTVETGIYDTTTNSLPPKGNAANNNPQAQGAPSSVVDPSTFSANQTFPSSADQAVRIDVNGDGTPDFFVQTYRTTPDITNANGELMAFGMGVRVYAYSANRNIGKLDTTKASLTMTTGLGEQRNRPLAVMYTNVVRSDTGVSLQCYQEFLGSTNITCR